MESSIEPVPASPPPEEVPAAEPTSLPLSSETSLKLELSMADLIAPSKSESDLPPAAEAVGEVLEPTEETPTVEDLVKRRPPAAPAPAAVQPPDEEDIQAAQDMPYIFGKKSDTPKQSSFLAEAMGDAVIPGGVAQAPDLDTIKKYLLLREQDVAVLSSQLKAIQNQVQLLEQMLREERAKNAELNHVANEQKEKIEAFEKEKARIVGKFESEMQDLNFQLKAKVDRAKIFESQIEESSEEMEHLKERVRSDIRKIRVRERELENRLEIMKKDSEALIGARESKIIELKRKLDLLEFNMDLLQDQYNREKDKSRDLKERLNKAAQIVRVAEGLLDTPTKGGKAEGDSGPGESVAA
ncbi:MAG: hypothetical protein HYX41_00245 [Bdellovibrio sp.]|nr:hypothetical protein [Bdellovibrio sp.]